MSGQIAVVTGGAFGTQPAGSTYTNKNSTAAYGRPIAIVYGTHRISGNIILSGLYFSTYGSVIINTGLTQTALCEGPISEVLAIWKEKTKYTVAGISATVLTGKGVDAYSAAVTYAKGAWVSSGGTNYASLQAGNLNHTPSSSPTWWKARGASATERAQAAWSTLTSTHPAYALGYGGTALICTSSGWGTTATGEVARANFEVSGLFTTATGLAQDVEPVAIIVDLLTNTEYGLGLATSLVDGYGTAGGIPYGFTTGSDGTAETSYTNYCQANQFKLSLALEEQRTTREVIQELSLATNSVAVWSGGTIKMRPLGLEYIAASGGRPTYDGPTSADPAYDLGFAQAGTDFLASAGDAPITVERAALKDHFNCYPVEWSNRAPTRIDATGATITEAFNAYNADLADGTPDPVDVSKYGLRKAEVTKLRCVTSLGHATYIANVLTQRSITARNVYRFRLGWRFALLEPCDYVTITDASLGLSRKLVRILEIEEDASGTFSIVAEEVSTVVPAYQPLFAVMSDNPIYGSCFGTPCTAVSSSVTCGAYGGSGSYTYSWAKVSGTTFTLSSTTAATITFSHSVSALSTAVYRCTVTDTVTTITAYADVTVELEGGL